MVPKPQMKRTTQRQFTSSGLASLGPHPGVRFEACRCLVARLGQMNDVGLVSIDSPPAGGSRSGWCQVWVAIMGGGPRLCPMAFRLCLTIVLSHKPNSNAEYPVSLEALGELKDAPNGDSLFYWETLMLMWGATLLSGCQWEERPS